MTKLQELIGLVEKANESSHWVYCLEYSFDFISVRRYPKEGGITLMEEEEEICSPILVGNELKISDLCFEIRNHIKEDTEIISKDEIQQLCKRAWNHGKESTKL